MLPRSKQRSHNPAIKGSGTPEKQPSSQVLADQSGVARKKQKDKRDGSEKKVTAKNRSEKKTVSTADCKDKSKQKSSDKGGKTGPEKHAAKGEIGRQSKDGKERDKERLSEKRKAVKDGVSGKERGAEKVGSEVKNKKKRNGKTADVLLAKDEGVEKVIAKPKKEKEKIECHIQNELPNPELEKELEKRAKRRDVSDDKDKRHKEVRKDDDRRYRESNDKHLSSSDDRRRSGYFQDEKHRDGRYSRDKLSDDIDMDHRHHDDRYYDERPSSKRTYEYIKEDIITESHKKTKLLDRDNDCDPYEDWTNSRDQRDMKRLYDECEDHRDLRLQKKKQPCVDVNVDSHIMEDKFTGRYLKESKLQGSDNYDDQFIDDHTKNFRDDRSMKRSPDGEDYHRDVRFRDKKQPRGDLETKALDTTRSRSNQGDSTQRSEKLPQEKYFSSSASRGDSSGFRNRESKDQTTGSVRKTVANRNYDKTTGSDSPVKCDTDLVRSRQKKGRGGNIISTSSSFSSRGGHSSPCGRPPRPPVKRQINNRADMSSFELDNTFQLGDHSTGLSQGNAWRSNLPWRPNANFFVPFQHCRPPPFQLAPGQFPIPFGLNQPMNMNPTGVYPFGYGPVDVTSHFHHWAGYNNLVPGNPHNYWLSNQNLMGNGEWERNPSMWNGQSNNVNMDPKAQETEYTPMPLVHDELDGKLNHESQSYQAQPEVVSDEKIEVKHSDTSSGKHTDETLPKNMSEKRTQPKICHVKSYLLKLDISPDLVSPELYNRCLTLLETRDANAETKSKQIKEATKATLKTPNQLSSLFPETKDAIFERTVSLFKKQNEARRLKLPVPDVFCKEGSNPPEVSNLVSDEMLDASNAEIVKELTDQASEEMSEASRVKIMKPYGDQASEEMSKASNVEIMKPLADLGLGEMSGENANAATDSEDELYTNLDSYNVYIVKPPTDQASREMPEASNTDVVKPLVDQTLGGVSEANVSATDSEDELYTGLDVVSPGKAMELQSDVTVIVENHSQVHETLNCSLPGTMSLH